jgi:hypothetical protein
MRQLALQRHSAWTEDKATLRSEEERRSRGQDRSRSSDFTVRGTLPLLSQPPTPELAAKRQTFAARRRDCPGTMPFTTR